jgi:chromosome partitioning protein
MGKTISLINIKGGVGKSTLAANLAWEFAGYKRWGPRQVLVVDLDPQFNASQYLLGPEQYGLLLSDMRPTVWDIFEQETRLPDRPRTRLDPRSAVRNVVSFVNESRVDLIPSRLELAFALKNPGRKERLLSKSLAVLRDDYDLIFIDCPPTESVFTTAAYLASDYVLVPVKPEYLSSIGLQLLGKSLLEFHHDYDDHSLEVAGVVFNNMTPDESPEVAQAKHEVRGFAREQGWYMFSNEVPFSRSFAKGAREGKPLYRTSHSRYWQAARMRSVTEELGARLGL